MPTAFQLTPAQARAYGIDVKPTRESKPRRQATTEERLVRKQILARIQLAEEFVESIAIVCGNYGWNVGLCRLPSDAPQNEDYNSYKGDEATPNCIMAWRECVEYANPRTMQLAWLWEIEDTSISQVGKMLQENFLREQEAIA